MSDDSLEEYRSRVHHASEQALDIMSEPDPIPRSDAVWDSCQGYPIYHSQVLDVLRHCDAEIGECAPYTWDGADHGWSVLRRMACELYRRDVQSHVSELRSDAKGGS